MPTRSPTARIETRLDALSASRCRRGLGQCRALQGRQLDIGLEHPRSRADNDPLRRVEVFALVGRRGRRPLVRAGHGVHQLVQVRGHGDRHAPDVGDGAPHHAGQDAAGAQLGQYGGASAAEGLE